MLVVIVQLPYLQTQPVALKAIVCTVKIMLEAGLHVVEVFYIL